MRWIVRVSVWLLVAVVAAACGQANEDSGTTVSDESAPRSVTVTPAPASEIPPRPDEPADINGDYRPDPAIWVANTGRPQLVEVFSYD